MNFRVEIPSANQYRARGVRKGDSKLEFSICGPRCVSHSDAHTAPDGVCHTLQREDLSSLHDQRHEGGTELPKDYSVGRGLRDARFTVAERWSVGKIRQHLCHMHVCGK